MSVFALKARTSLYRGQSGPDVRDLQSALFAYGHQIVIDGEFGVATEVAVKRFQAAHGLPADGIVGPMTAGQLAIPKPEPAEPELPSSKAAAPWLMIARALTGTKEIPGGRNNPLILSWPEVIAAKYPDLAANLLWYKDDATPWCGLFVAYCLAKADFMPASAPLYALNNGSEWVRERHGIKLPGPALGAIVTMKRSGGGHVTFYEGEDDDHWFGRGGNQSDMVNVARFPKSRPIEGYFWPASAPMPVTGPVHATFSAAVAGSEA